MTISKNPKKIQELFDVIAEKYDFNNNIISLGLHKTKKPESKFTFRPIIYTLLYIK